MEFTFRGAGGAIAALGVAQGAIQGMQERGQLENEAQFTAAEQKAADLQRARDVQGAEQNTDAAIARRRALLAAGGASGTAQATALLDSAAATGAQNVTRINQDAAIQRSTLRARRYNLKAAAAAAPFKGAFMGGLGAAPSALSAARSPSSGAGRKP